MLSISQSTITAVLLTVMAVYTIVYFSIAIYRIFIRRTQDEVLTFDYTSILVIGLFWMGTAMWAIELSWQLIMFIGLLFVAIWLILITCMCICNEKRNEELED